MLSALLFNMCMVLDCNACSIIYLDNILYFQKKLYLLSNFWI